MAKECGTGMVKGLIGEGQIRAEECEIMRHESGKFNDIWRGG